MSPRRVLVVGAGYVGLVTGACLSDIGHEVVCLDVDANRVEMLRQGQVPIYEPGLDEVLTRNLGKGLKFTTDYGDGLPQADVVIVAVGTPSDEQGDANLTYVWQVVDSLAAKIDHPLVVAIKSTVPVGVCDQIGEHLSSMLKKRLGEKAPMVAVLSNPEFLREGRAVSDFMKADRVVIGGEDEWAVNILKEVYAPLNAPIVTADRRSSELIKYGSNAFLATKISFINSIGHLCERLGADVVKVAEGMGYDHRIKSEHLRAGLGYGGSCFPKDTAALLGFARKAGYRFEILEATVKVNEGQVEWAVSKLREELGNLDDKVIAVWGLAFKPHTDDTRDSQAMKIVERLLDEGAVVRAFDPEVKSLTFTKESKRLYLATDKYDATRGAHALVLATEWPEFIEADFAKVKLYMKNALGVDARNCLSAVQLAEVGFTYRFLGRPLIESQVNAEVTKKEIAAGLENEVE